MQSGSAGLLRQSSTGSVHGLSTVSLRISCVTTPSHPIFLESTSMPPRCKFSCKSKETMTSVVSPDHFCCLTGLRTAISAWSCPSSTWCQSHLLKPNSRASLVAQWLRIHLPMQGTWV